MRILLAFLLLLATLALADGGGGLATCCGDKECRAICKPLSLQN